MIKTNLGVVIITTLIALTQKRETQAKSQMFKRLM